MLPSISKAISILRYTTRDKKVLAVSLLSISGICVALTQASAGPPTLGTDKPAIEKVAPVNSIVRSSASEVVDEVANRLVKHDEPGLAVMVAKNGEVLHMAGYGYADVERGALINGNTAFHLGSTGKQFTALAALLLVQDGLLDLDAPISTYIPAFDRRHPKITMRHLLTHTSGLASYYPNRNPDGWEVFQNVWAESQVDMPTHMQSITVELQLDPAAAPETEWVYSNSGYELAAAIIETIANQPFQQFLHERLFDPIGMNDAFTTPNPARLRDANTASSYNGVRGSFERVIVSQDPWRKDLDAMQGAGSIYASLNDMIAYDRAWNRGMPLIEPALIEQMLTPVSLADGSTFNYGFGLFLTPPETELEQSATDRAQNDRAQAFFHGGSWPSFTTLYLRFPEQELGIFWSLNRNPSVADYAPLFERPGWYPEDEAPGFFGFFRKLGEEISGPFMEAD